MNAIVMQDRSGVSRIDVICSIHDGGYYAEVWDTETGRELYTTPVAPTPDEAMDLAHDWINGEVG